MKIDDAKFLAEAAAVFAQETSLRDACSTVVPQFASVVSARVSFIALRKPDGLADIIACEGLGASDFRRLEARIVKSSIWRIFAMQQPVAVDDISKEAALDFVSFATGSRLLIAVPIVVDAKIQGLAAAAFERTVRVDESRVIIVLNAVAAMTAQTVRLSHAVEKAASQTANESVSRSQRLKELFGFSTLVGNSSQMRAVYDQVSQIARTNSAVLLRGEVGTGKELIAKVIHYNSLRSKRPFAAFSCAAFPQNLLTNELFGHTRRGRIEQADGGTFYIDEIADLPSDAQKLLVDVLERNEFTRPEHEERVFTNVRLIAGTSRDLERLVNDGQFDRELSEKLALFTTFVPPLRERKSDILLLAEHFVERLAEKYERSIKRISTPAIDMLTAYHFPGNVRELENVIEHAVLNCDANVIHGHHLPPTLQTAEESGTEVRVTLESAVATLERDLIQDTLKSTHGNIARAAKLLDSTERILGYKISKYNIDARRFRR